MKKLKFVQYVVLTFIFSFVFILHTHAQLAGKKAVMVIASEPPAASETKVKERLESSGLLVTTVAEAQANDNSITGFDILLISCEVVSTTVAANMPGLASYEIPIVNWEPGLYDELKFSAENGKAFDEPTGEIEITGAGHPLAAGLSGVVSIATGAWRLGGVVPEGDAVIIAKSVADPTLAVLFSYETGANLTSGTAPARRVGTFLLNAFEDILTEDAWKLFDASVVWALEDNSTAINENTVHSGFYLSGNYPNPVSHSTTIRYQLENPGMVTMKIYNSTGQEIETLISKFQGAGEYTINWQPKDLSDGIYFYQLQAGEFSETRKLIIQK